MRLPFPLDLRSAGDSRFELLNAPASGRRVLGAGLVAASVVSAGRTVGINRHPASLHVTFLAPVHAEPPFSLEVHALHEGRTSSVRAVSIIQADRLRATGTVRFHSPSSGPTWSAEPSSTSSAPSEGRSEDSAVASMEVLDGFHIRAAVPAGSVDRPVLHPYWTKTRTRLDDDPVAHAAVLAFLTDIGVSGSAVQPGARMRERLAAVTLDHYLTWHVPFRADRWMYVDASPVVNGSGRGVANGQVRDEEGALLATFTQHVLREQP